MGRVASWLYSGKLVSNRGSRDPIFYFEHAVFHRISDSAQNNKINRWLLLTIGNAHQTGSSYL